VVKLFRVTAKHPMTWDRLSHSQRKKILTAVFIGASDMWIRQFKVAKWEDIPTDAQNEMHMVGWYKLLTRS
jgi:hypothetical protein